MPCKLDVQMQLPESSSTKFWQRAGAYATSVGEFEVAGQHFHCAAEAAPDIAARHMATIQVRPSWFLHWREQIQKLTV